MAELTIQREFPLSSFIKRNSNAILASLIVGVLLLMIIPVPTFLLDFFFVLNIASGLTILVLSIYINKPLDFSTFPSVLLFTTLFRLGLNISSTRLILLNGDQGGGAAGKIIETFGAFVVGGNYVVGIIIFIILILINFIVITKGSGRIAEVAARFTLDAMPGKQMAIDADLSSGLIDEESAKKRRKEVSQESDFYGAMDGASKFVRGDAIVGIIITFVNVIGGLIVGVFQKGLSFGEAGKNYTILTIGDGLVSQIPSLVISTAAGIIVSRIATEKSFGIDVGSQILKNRKVLYLVSGILVLFMLIPGMPKLLFLFTATILAAYGYFAKREVDGEDSKTTSKKTGTPALPNGSPSGDSADKPKTEEEQLEGLLGVDLAELEVGYGLIPLVDTAQDGRLIERIKGLRKQFASSLGIIIPSIHIRDNLRLQPEEYVFMVKGSEIGRYKVFTDKLMAMAPDGIDMHLIKGEPAKEPAFGLDAVWITPKDKNRAEALGFTVVDVATVISTHLTELIRKNSHKIIGREEVRKLLDIFSKKNAKLVEELIPTQFSLGELVTLLKNLLYEGVSIKDLHSILETVSDNIHKTKNVDILTEFVRQNLAGYITSQFSTDKTLYVLMLSPQLEEQIRNSLKSGDGGITIALPPQKSESLVQDLTQAKPYFENFGAQPLLLVAPELRRGVKNYIDRFVAGYNVISYNEISGNVEIKPIASLD